MMYMYNCIFCGEKFYGTPKLKIHLVSHNLTEKEIEDYVGDQVKNYSQLIKKSKSRKKATLKTRKMNEQQKEKKSQRFNRVKNEIANVLLGKGYPHSILKEISEAKNYRVLSLILQRRAKKFADSLHKEYSINIARINKMESGNKKNQGLFDRTISSIRAIITPMGNKK